MTEKFCISCGQSGHTYLECKTTPFFDVLAGAFGLPNILGSTSNKEPPMSADPSREAYLAAVRELDMELVQQNGMGWPMFLLMQSKLEARGAHDEALIRAAKAEGLREAAAIAEKEHDAARARFNIGQEWSARTIANAINTQAAAIEQGEPK